MVSLTNSSRGQAGLPPLRVSGALSSVAAAWADHMAATGALAHNPGLSGSVSGWTLIGENVGQTLASQGASGAEALFMGSSAHRGNILDPRYNQVGVGVTRSGPYLWVVVDFMAAGAVSAPPPPPPPPPTTPRPVTTAPATHVSSPTQARSTAAQRVTRSAVRAPVAVHKAVTKQPAPRVNRMAHQDARDVALDSGTGYVEAEAVAPAAFPAPVSGRSIGGLALWLMILGLALVPAVLRVRRSELLVRRPR
jgi:hypothetical protein